MSLDLIVQRTVEWWDSPEAIDLTPVKRELGCLLIVGHLATGPTTDHCALSSVRWSLVPHHPSHAIGRLVCC